MDSFIVFLLRKEHILLRFCRNASIEVSLVKLVAGEEHLQRKSGRYMIARKLRLRAGIDVARGPEDWAYYIVLGSYWAR